MKIATTKTTYQASKLGELTPHQRAALYWPGIQVFLTNLLLPLNGFSIYIFHFTFLHFFFCNYTDFHAVICRA